MRRMSVSWQPNSKTSYLGNRKRSRVGGAAGCRQVRANGPLGAAVFRGFLYSSSRLNDERIAWYSLHERK